jgi:glycosyltransferase involved in cell wall biosynthesis
MVVDMPKPYVLYPAQTWPHKNHIRLINALAHLRAQGNRIDLVAVGRMNEFFPKIEAAIQAAGVSDQIHFLGHVDEEVLAGLYRGAAAVVFPSLFEGWGLPVVEAFAFGLPVAASNASVIPEVAAGAALLFNPMSEEAIALAVDRVVNDAQLRSDLTKRGAKRSLELSWQRTAATFLALYRKIAGLPMTPEQEGLLAPPTLVGDS